MIGLLVPLGAAAEPEAGSRYAVLGLGDRTQGDEALGALAVEALLVDWRPGG